MVVDDAVERKVVPVDPVPLPVQEEEEINYISDYSSDYQDYQDYQYNTLDKEEEEYNAVADYEYTDPASDVALAGGNGDLVEEEANQVFNAFPLLSSLSHGGALRHQ